MSTATEAVVVQSGPPEGLNDFGKSAWTMLNDSIVERNKIASVLLAAQGDIQATLEALRENSDNPKVVAINEQIDKLTDALDKLETERDSLLGPEVDAFKANAEGQQEGLTKKVDEADSLIRASRGYIKKMFNEDALKGLPTLTPIKGRSSSGGGTGTRIRGYDVFVDGALATSKDAKGVERSSMSAGAKAAKVDTAVIQEGFKTAQGTTDVNKYKERVEFTVKDNDDADHVVVCVKQGVASSTTDADVAEAETAGA